MTTTTRVLAAALDLKSFSARLLAATASVSENTVRSTLNRYARFFIKDAELTEQRRRGGQRQTWTVNPDLREELVALVRADTRDGDAPLGHLRLNPGGELVTRVAQPTRTPEAIRELASEYELGTYNWQSGSLLLPELAVRLISRTPGLKSFLMGTGLSIADASFDGRVEVSPSADAWPVPSGNSVWELGAGDSNGGPVAKAMSDYKKRTENPEGVDRTTTTFVFMTNKRCPELEEWADAMRAQKEWADVQAIDAQTLWRWLLRNRPVHVWLSERLGLRPTEVASLDNWFKEWQAQTNPAMPRALLVTGRDDEASKLCEAAKRSGESVGVYSKSREESLAFVASVLSREPMEVTEPPAETRVAQAETTSESETEAIEPEEGRFNAGLIVKTPAEWSRIVDTSDGDGILIPQFDGADVATATANGFTVIMPMGIGDDRDRADIKLPPIHVLQAMEALQKAGVSHDAADGLAQAIDRSLTAFRRSHAVSPTYPKPAWATDWPDLAALTLLGGWNSDNEADKEVVATLTHREYFEVEQDLHHWASREDPPFITSGNNWQLVDPIDAFALVGNSLSKGLLDLWVSTVAPVLRELDPLVDLSPEENFTATVKGVRRDHSSALRSGIARGTAMLGSSERRFQGVSDAEYARRLVRDVLVANPTPSNWKALADVLPWLAEAAPDQFLEAVRASLIGSAPVLAEMFTDHGPEPMFGGSSPHTHLLWALELLAQSKDHAADALFQLAHLAEVEPGGRMNNRPAESLQRLLLAWYPQNALTPEGRLRAVTRIEQMHPKVGWQLVLGLLPHFDSLSHRAYLPAFRDWHPPVATTLPEAVAAYSGYANLALELATKDPAKWKELIPAVPYLPWADRDEYIDFLEKVNPDGWTQEVRLANSRALSELVAKHRQFPDAKWVMPEAPLARLEAVAPKWSPLDLVDRVSPLFMLYPDIPDARRFSDHDAYREEGARHQRRELMKVLEVGEDALIKLVHNAPEPEVVGSTLADLASDLAQIPGADRQLFGWFGESDAMKRAARGWMLNMLFRTNNAWLPTVLAEIRKLNEAARAYAYRWLRAYPEVLDVVAADSPIVRSAFWAASGVEFMRSDRQQDIVAGFLEHDDPAGALEYLSYRSHQDDIECDLIVTVLETDSLLVAAMQNTMAIYELENLLNKLEVSGTEQSKLASLEWRYFQLLQHSRAPRAFFASLREHPEYFVELISLVFRAASDPPRSEDEPDEPADYAAAYNARTAYSLLQDWRTPPGTGTDGKIDAAELGAWVKHSRELLVDSDRIDIGDECIGQLLSGSQKGEDGIWPAEPIRDLLEELSSQHLADGLAMGRFNSRGTTTRGPSDGGAQERALAKQYEEWATKVSPEWPATGRLLRELSRTYEEWAAREDEMWEQWRDER
jgi:hypothetical protein